jgi:hypothetical protein
MKHEAFSRGNAKDPEKVLFGRKGPFKEAIRQGLAALSARVREVSPWGPSEARDAISKEDPTYAFGAPCHVFSRRPRRIAEESAREED